MGDAWHVVVIHEPGGLVPFAAMSVSQGGGVTLCDEEQAEAIAKAWNDDPREGGTAHVAEVFHFDRCPIDPPGCTGDRPEHPGDPDTMNAPIHHVHPLSLNGTASSQFTMAHEHERGDEPHSHSVTPDGKSYTSTEFERDAFRDRSPLQGSDPVRAALLVLVETPATRAWLVENDPKALDQALAALSATTSGTSLIPVSIESVVIQNDSIDNDGVAAVCHVAGSEHFGVHFAVPVVAGGSREAAEAVLRGLIEGAGVYHVVSEPH